MIGQLTLAEIRGQVARHIQDSSSSRATKIDEWVNKEYFDIATAYDWPQLTRSAEQTISITSGAAFLYLPPEVEKIHFILPANSGTPLQNSDLFAMFNRANASSTVAGLTMEYAEAGEFARRYDFYATGEALKIAQAGYAATSTAYVTGVVTAVPGSATSDEIGEAVTVSASEGVYTITPSGIAGLTYRDVHSFSVATNPTGYYYLKGVVSGTIYAVIPPGWTSVRYRRIRLMQTPDATSAVTIYWKKRVARLVNDSQAVEIPVGYVLVDKVIAAMYSNQREYNAAMQYHEGRAMAQLERLLGSSTQQGEQIELGQPMVASRANRIVIVNG